MNYNTDKNIITSHFKIYKMYIFDIFFKIPVKLYFLHIFVLKFLLKEFTFTFPFKFSKFNVFYIYIYIYICVIYVLLCYVILLYYYVLLLYSIILK